MKQVKRMLAVLLAVLLTFAVVGCHPKNEIAVTIKGEEFTSAYYMCALIYADMEGRQMVDAELAEKEKDKADSEKTEEVDYTKQKIEGKKFSKWVKARALENLKSITAYKVKCKDAKITIPEEELATTQTYAEYYWSSYGYAQMFEPNGVGKATFTTYMTDAIYAELYFEHLYGKGGEKEIAADKVESTMLEKLLLVEMIDVTFQEETDEQKKEIKTKLDGYVADLQKGTKTFEQVYHDYNGGEHTEEPVEEGQTKPVNTHASVLGAEGTGFESEHYETAKAMKDGEIKLIEKENAAGYTLLVKRELSADKYYHEQLDMSVRHIIADEEYTADMEKFAKDLKVETNKSAVNLFKVEKIVYPTMNQ